MLPDFKPGRYIFLSIHTLYVLFFWGHCIYHIASCFSSPWSEPFTSIPSRSFSPGWSPSFAFTQQVTISHLKANLWVLRTPAVNISKSLPSGLHLAITPPVWIFPFLSVGPFTIKTDIPYLPINSAIGAHFNTTHTMPAEAHVYAVTVRQ